MGPMNNRLSSMHMGVWPQWMFYLVIYIIEIIYNNYMEIYTAQYIHSQDNNSTCGLLFYFGRAYMIKITHALSLISIPYILQLRPLTCQVLYI